ncbi:Putative zn(2)-C6 fungal-type DNA-binding domain-containing protein [Septoria linicola]|uniref:Zn(2)-C6 fungal-type DNA-binding domain-containing protein n=1 Tax=Septoria linicola TaxID=215465 RepID=A0A9Q9ELX0_9PEZI|nr:Putative zn(2)-C6 fungal-type DNA-binding domain-containing protein [Septoria linicola]
MSHQSTNTRVFTSSEYQPYQTSDYDRAIQQAAERERAAQAERTQSTTPTGLQNGSGQPSQSLRLPGLNDLFASKLLINPNMADGRKTPTYNELRRDSVAGPNYFDTSCRPGFMGRTDAMAPAPLVIAPPQQRSSSQTSPISIQNLCSPQDATLPSRTPSLSTSPTASQTSASSLLQPMPHVKATSPHELPPAFFGTSDLAPATYVYQAASSYEGVSYIPGRGPCHMYAGGYSIPTHIFQDPLNLTQSKILRKRLSVACSTCRKKKIKCEPGPEGCLQCKKAQRPCKIEPAKRRLKSSAASSFQAEKSPA